MIDRVHKSTIKSSLDMPSDLHPQSVHRVELYRENGDVYQDILAEEEPLTLVAHGDPYAVFMRTPGADQELIYGFLRTEEIIESADDVHALVPCVTQPLHRARLMLASGVSLPKRERRSFISSSCGLCSLSDLGIEAQIRGEGQGVLGLDKSTGGLHGWSPRALSASDLKSYYDSFDQHPSLFSLTGGAHAAALFNPRGQLCYHQSDVGRHNAVDKVVGEALLAGERQLWGWSLWVSSRAGYEIVAKAIAAQVSALVTLGAASGAAHRIAVARGLPLYSFTRAHRTHRHLT